MCVGLDISLVGIRAATSPCGTASYLARIELLKQGAGGSGISTGNYRLSYSHEARHTKYAEYSGIITHTVN